MEHDEGWDFSIYKNDPVVPVSPSTKTCGECPALCMYRDITEALKKEPVEVQEHHLVRWFCHVDQNQCRGVAAAVRGSRKVA
jgi:hypothetical protein